MFDSPRPALPFEPAQPAVTLTHGGLADLDPWAEAITPARPRAGLLWPVGLGAVAETLEVVALALLMFMLVRFAAQNYVVDGSSMEPNFRDGELLLVNKLAYRSFDISWLPWTENTAWRPFGDPRPGDVVVGRFPQNPEHNFIKRVIAVPGQTVELRDGLLLLDDVPVDEFFLDDVTRYRFGPQVVPEDKFFVLGDNRNNSYDSHYWGMVDRSLIIGRADLRYWPFDSAGTVPHFRLEPRSLAEVSPSP